MSRELICTVVSPHFARQARGLIDHATSQGYEVLALDIGCGLAPADSVTVLTPDSMLDRVDAVAFSVSFDATQIASLLLPRLLRHGFGMADVVMWLHPATLLLDPLDEPFAIARSQGAFFTSAAPSQWPSDDRYPTASELADRSALDGSMAAFGGDRGRKAVEWWCDRTQAEEAVALAAGVSEDPLRIRTGPELVDWLARIPVTLGFPVQSSERGWARSRWNLSDAEISTTETGGLAQGGHPIRSLILDEMDLESPWWLGPTPDRVPRVRLSVHPFLHQHVQAWAGQARQHLPPGAAPSLPVPALGDGTLVDRRMRRTYERGLRENDRCMADLRTPEGAVAFRTWLNQPSPGTRVGRYLRTIWEERPDVRSAFPDALRSQAEAYIAWVHDSALKEEGVPDWLVPIDPRIAKRELAERVQEASARGLRQGVLVSGYLGSVMGLGEAARLVVEAVDGSGIEHATLTYSATAAEQADEFVERGDSSLQFDTHIACVNIDTFDRFAGDLGAPLFEGRHTIGLWFWETSEIPTSMQTAFERVDEIWVASRFVGDIMRAHCDKPVRTYPQPVPVPARSELSRRQLGLPEGFTYLFAFDFNSVLERKNPLGLVDAFRRAFDPGDGPELVIKTINGHKRVSDMERLALAVLDRPDIHIVDEFFPTWKRDAWTAACDCYVSLHRSEGFGLTMAEAMALGKPVIASRYGGNLQFMNDENSLLVDVSPGVVPAGCAPYPAGSQWGEPDIAHAATCLRRVHDDPALRSRIGEAARRTITTEHSNEAMSRWIVETLEARWEAARADTPVAYRAPRRLVARARGVVRRTLDGRDD